jgi:phosphatidylserine/phosphatidylglycerophosphate/cardiolipin synthase-like enzyme
MMVNEDGFRIQTANLTKSSLESNREHFYYGTDPDIRENLVKLFDIDRQGSGLKASDLHPNLVVCPMNCRAIVEALLESAKESILIQTQYILDPQILQIVRHQSTKVDLNIIVANTDTNQDLVKYF